MSDLLPTDSESLLSCPFCGHSAALHEDDAGRWQQVVCGGCGAKGPERMKGYIDKAINRWNGRTGETPQPSANRRLKKHEHDCHCRVFEYYDVDEVDSEIKRLQGSSARSWQPIDTAPKHYKPILLRQDETVGEGWWSNHMDYWEFANPAYVLRHKPLQWMPLPDSFGRQPTPSEPPAAPKQRALDAAFTQVLHLLTCNDLTGQERLDISRALDFLRGSAHEVSHE